MNVEDSPEACRQVARAGHLHHRVLGATVLKYSVDICSHCQRVCHHVLQQGTRRIASCKDSTADVQEALQQMIRW